MSLGCHHVLGFVTVDEVDFVNLTGSLYLRW